MISPFYPSTCRHEPSCSQYTVEAIEEWGPLKGMWLGIKRLGKCHPLGTWGPDPVPPNPKRRSKNYVAPEKGASINKKACCHA